MNNPEPCIENSCIGVVHIETVPYYTVGTGSDSSAEPAFDLSSNFSKKYTNEY
jgi:hypothetical protein